MLDRTDEPGTQGRLHSRPLLLKCGGPVRVVGNDVDRIPALPIDVRLAGHPVSLGERPHRHDGSWTAVEAAGLPSASVLTVLWMALTFKEHAARSARSLPTSGSTAAGLRGRTGPWEHPI